MKKFWLKISSLLLFMTATAQSQDWPNLERFKAENDSLGLPGEHEERVVFMGNSITQGWIDYGNPALFKENTYINRGISGQTTPQMLLRFRADVIDLKPKAVVILAGINDIAGNTGPSTLKMIQDNFKSMVELAQANQIKVIITSILPANKFAWKPGIEPADSVIEMNTFLKTYATENNCYYLDYYSALVDDKKGMKAMYSEDGVHPTILGYDIMTPLVLNAIKNVLKELN
ncbi:SGNH/GDSL hydrolase family protein [Cellulophaga sp. E16_2]|uniref:SGNH/GDSL hydrolase family protein n=1 Tax=Cellulophaga sp. E16_2 TaxID=2789297 RepID=UPI001A9200F0|nr:SGNH/GDSL hydrolase family protein [Cellulophaga sp. E16_2]MBO0593111.1 SGNH/GDSL hydrolase family protein [Cellulophaga sp. E16_2]